MSTFGGGATEEGESSGVTDDSATPTVDTSVPGTTEALPQASIPTPALKTSSPVSALIVTSAANSTSYTPVVGYDGAGVEGDMIVVLYREKNRCRPEIGRFLFSLEAYLTFKASTRVISHLYIWHAVCLLISGRSKNYVTQL